MSASPIYLAILLMMLGEQIVAFLQVWLILVMQLVDSGYVSVERSKLYTLLCYLMCRREFWSQESQVYEAYCKRINPRCYFTSQKREHVQRGLLCVRFL